MWWARKNLKYPWDQHSISTYFVQLELLSTCSYKSYISGRILLFDCAHHYWGDIFLGCKNLYTPYNICIHMQAPYILSLWEGSLARISTCFLHILTFTNCSIFSLFFFYYPSHDEGVDYLYLRDIHNTEEKMSITHKNDISVSLPNPLFFLYLIYTNRGI